MSQNDAGQSPPTFATTGQDSVVGGSYDLPHLSAQLEHHARIVAPLRAEVPPLRSTAPISTQQKGVVAMDGASLVPISVDTPPLRSSGALDFTTKPGSESATVNHVVSYVIIIVNALVQGISTRQ